MKFAKRMSCEMVAQWQEFYVCYKRLKVLVHSEGDDETPIGVQQFSDLFSSTVLEELEKSSTFFAKLIQELARRLKEFPGSVVPSVPLHPTRPDEGVELVEISLFQSADVPKSENPPPPSSFPNFHHEEPPTRTSPVSELYAAFLSPHRASIVTETCNVELRSKFMEWNSHALRAQQFAALNAEAIRKATKKMKKYRKKAAGLCSANLEVALENSDLVSLVKPLHSMIDQLAFLFEREFGEAIDRYESLTILEKEKWHLKWHLVLLGVVLFGISFAIPVFKSDPAAHRCFSLFVLVIELWITEAIPFFCTAIMIPLVAIPLGILRDPTTGSLASASVASKSLLGGIFNDIQVLVLGGLTIAKALNKTNLEIHVALWLQRYTAHRPSLYLLGLMVISCLISSLVSNIAAPLLVLGVIQRTIWEMPRASTAPQGILLGLAFACNLGGMLSPISSPQNAVGLGVLNSIGGVNFGTWIGVAFPLVSACLVASWGLILLIWKPFKEGFVIPIQLPSHSKKKRTSTVDVIVVLAVSACTVILWCIPADLLFGDTAVVAIIPILCFFGIGILDKDDFNNLSWHLMFLLAGGNMLGRCAQDAGLVEAVARGMGDVVAKLSPYGVLGVVLLCFMIVTTFVSHTVAAMVMLPIIAELGKMLPASHGPFDITAKSLVFLCVMMCSGAMTFSVSSFPNINSLLAEDDIGVPYLRSRDFLVVGSLVTLVVFTSLVTWMVPIAVAAM